MPLSAPLRSAVSGALALLVPGECAGCGTHDVALCEACRRLLTPDPVLGRSPDGLVVCHALPLEGTVARVVRAFKGEGRTALASDLAPALAAAVQRVACGASVVPIPASRAAMRRRGYRVVDLLATRADLDVRRALAPARAVADQRTLDRAQRRENVRGAFRALPRRVPRRLLLVDDVVTTGATLDEAARVLRAAGATVLGAAVLAKTPLQAPAVPPERTRRKITGDIRSARG